MHSGDTVVLARNSTPRCDVCTGLVKDIRVTYDGGGRYEEGSWNVRSARTQGSVSPSRAFVTMAVRIDEGKEIRSTGSEPKQSKSSVGNIDVILGRRSGKWVVRSLAAT